MRTLSMRRLHRSEAGMTLIEMTIALMLLAIVISVFMTTLFSVQRSFDRQTDRSQSNDQARLAVQQIDREVRSGNLLYDPALEAPAGMALRIYTQTNANTRDPGNRCVQWLIDQGQLKVRNWSVTWRIDGKVGAWRTVADNIVNETHAPPAAAFALDPASSGRTLMVNILVNANPSSGRDVQIQSSVTGRNTEYGYPQDICNDVPQ